LPDGQAPSRPLLGEGSEHGVRSIEAVASEQQLLDVQTVLRP
jgi:hypothetical protein